MNKQWVTQQSYDHKRDKKTYANKLADPAKYGLTKEELVSQTIPGQSQTVAQLMERYIKGRPIPQE